MINIIHVGPIHCAAISSFCDVSFYYFSTSEELLFLNLFSTALYSLSLRCMSEMAFLLTGEFLCMFAFVCLSFE